MGYLIFIQIIRTILLLKWSLYILLYCLFLIFSIRRSRLITTHSWLRHSLAVHRQHLSIHARILNYVFFNILLLLSICFFNWCYSAPKATDIKLRHQLHLPISFIKFYRTKINDRLSFGLPFMILFGVLIYSICATVSHLM